MYRLKLAAFERHTWLTFSTSEEGLFCKVGRPIYLFLFHYLRFKSVLQIWICTDPYLKSPPGSGSRRKKIQENVQVHEVNTELEDQ